MVLIKDRDELGFMILFIEFDIDRQPNLTIGVVKGAIPPRKLAPLAHITYILASLPHTTLHHAAANYQVVLSSIPSQSFARAL